MRVGDTFATVAPMTRLLLLMTCAPLLQSTSLTSEPGARPTVDWDRSTLRLVAPGGDYARMARLGDGAIGVAYDLSLIHI